jgi:hypothetical protein
MAAVESTMRDRRRSSTTTSESYAHRRRTSQSVTLQLPPNYPPFERFLDVRIPMHFSECRLKELKDPYDFDYGAYQDLHYQVTSLFSGRTSGGATRLEVDPLDRPFRAMFQYCVMKPKHRWSKMQDDVRFFAVSVRDVDIERWSDIHSRLVTLIGKFFPDLDDPPIRYFRMNNTVGSGAMMDEDYGFVDYDDLDGF